MTKLIKNNIFRLVTALVIVSTLSNCTPKELSPKELISWVENPANGFVKEKTLGELDFRVRYKPLDYIIAKENQQNIITDSSYKKSEERLKGLEYVNFTIYPSNKKQFDVLKHESYSDQEVREKIYYYSFTFQKDIYIEQGGEKLPCELFHFVRDHGLSPDLNFALGFERKENKGDLKIVINDIVFGNGELNYIIKEKDITGLPALKI